MSRLERPFVAGVLRHREDWNCYAKRTLGKDFHHFWDEDKRQRTERDELNQITTGMSGSMSSRVTGLKRRRRRETGGGTGEPARSRRPGGARVQGFAIGRQPE